MPEWPWYLVVVLTAPLSWFAGVCWGRRAVLFWRQATQNQARLRELAVEEVVKERRLQPLLRAAALRLATGVLDEEEDLRRGFCSSKGGVVLLDEAREIKRLLEVHDAG